MSIDAVVVRPFLSSGEAGGIEKIFTAIFDPPSAILVRLGFSAAVSESQESLELAQLEKPKHDSAKVV